VGVGLGLATWLYIVWAYKGQPGDDPYITYRYAYNLVAGNGFVFNAGERVQSTTAPLFTILLALGMRPSGELLASPLGKHAKVLFLGLFLALGDLLLHQRSLANLFSSMALGNEQSLGHFGELVADDDLLQATPVCSETLVQRDGVSLGVLPVGHARGNDPVSLLLCCQLACW